VPLHGKGNCLKEDEESMDEDKTCSKRCEVYSRVVGYYRPVQNWNNGKREEFKDRLEYSEHVALSKKFDKAQEVTITCDCSPSKKA
jgi:hypothetical protein